jgi:hypothetical protein
MLSTLQDAFFEGFLAVKKHFATLVARKTNAGSKSSSAAAGICNGWSGMKKSVAAAKPMITMHPILLEALGMLPMTCPATVVDFFATKGMLLTSG